MLAAALLLAAQAASASPAEAEMLGAFKAACSRTGSDIEAMKSDAPTGVESPAPGLTRRLWEPGWQDGISVEVSHVPQKHELGQQYGLSGNVLTAQAIGGC